MMHVLHTAKSGHLMDDMIKLVTNQQRSFTSVSSWPAGQAAKQYYEISKYASKFQFDDSHDIINGKTVPNLVRFISCIYSMMLCNYVCR